MKTCPVASKCQWGHCIIKNACGLNDNDYCRKLKEELEMYFYKVTEGESEDEQELICKRDSNRI